MERLILNSNIFPIFAKVIRNDDNTLYQNMDISVIIVNYNVKDFLVQCLNSVHIALQGIDSEIIVIDNNSTDG